MPHGDLLGIENFEDAVKGIFVSGGLGRRRLGCGRGRLHRLGRGGLLGRAGEEALRSVTVGGRTPYTGFVTNNLTGEVLYFDQGFNKGNPEEGL